MLVQSSAVYFLSNLIVGVVSFLAIATYTRIVEPAEYGLFAIALATVHLLDTCFFSWVRQSLTRLLPAQKDKETFLLNVVLLHAAIFAVGLVVVCIARFHDTGFSWIFVALIFVFFCIRGLVELKLCILRVQIRAMRFFLTNLSRVLTQFGAAMLFITADFGAEGMLVGYILGACVSFLVAGAIWRLSQFELKTGMVREVLVFGLPLFAGFASMGFVEMFGRLFLGWLNMIEEAAIFSVTYDTATWPLRAIMISVSMAGFPLIIKYIENGNERLVDYQLRQQISLLLLFALPATIGLMFIADNFVEIALGKPYRDEASRIMPILVAACLLNGLRAYYFDYAFLIRKRIYYLAMIHGSAALVCVSGNLLLVPSYGIFGASYALLIAYSFALGVGIFFGRRQFVLPIPITEVIKIAFSVLLMSTFLLLFISESGWSILFAQIFGGLLVYFVATVAMNTMNIREYLNLPALRKSVAAFRDT